MYSEAEKGFGVRLQQFQEISFARRVQPAGPAAGCLEQATGASDEAGAPPLELRFLSVVSHVEELAADAAGAWELAWDAEDEVYAVVKALVYFVE